MPHELPASTLFQFVREDFRKAWDSMATVEFNPGVGGNFMFARQAMTLLELVCRVAAADESGATLADFSAQLERGDPLLFTMLPGGPPGPPNGLALPSSQEAGHPTHWQLIAVLFDLIRNGQAHQYQQIPVTLADGAILDISIGGVQPGRLLSTILAEPGRRSVEHLMIHRQGRGNFWVCVDPAVLFLDFEGAAIDAQVFERGLAPEWLTRPWRGGWEFSGDQLEASLSAAGYLWTSDAPAPDDIRT
jgi:hypothetical protein